MLVIGEKTRRETRREEIFEPHRVMARYHCSERKIDQSTEVECIFLYTPNSLLLGLSLSLLVLLPSLSPGRVLDEQLPTREENRETD